MIPAAFEYFRAHSADEAAALLAAAWSRGPRAGGRAEPGARHAVPPGTPGVLVDINPAKDLDYIHLDGALVIGALTRDVAIERAAWIRDRRWSLLRDVSRVVADPVVRQTATVVGSLCHNDPAGDWTTVALAARAEVDVRGKGGTAPSRWTISSWTASRRRSVKASWPLAVRFPVPDDRTAGSYQKIERKVGDFATAAAAVQVSLNADGTMREAGIALSAAGPLRGAR